MANQLFSLPNNYGLTVGQTVKGVFSGTILDDNGIMRFDSLEVTERSKVSTQTIIQELRALREKTSGVQSRP